MPRAIILTLGLLAGCILPGLPSPGRAEGLRRPLPGDPLVERIQVLDGTTGGALPGAAGLPGGPEPVRGGRPADRPGVRLPEGWVLGAPDMAEPPPISLFTRVVQRTVVAWPEMDVRIRVVDERDRPVRGAEVEVMGNDTRSERSFDGERVISRSFSRSPGPAAFATTGPDGVARPRGLAAVPGTRWTPCAEEGDRSGAGEGWTVEEPRTVVERTIVLHEGARGLRPSAIVAIG